MKDAGSTSTDQQLDRALRQTLGEAPVPALAYDFGERLSAEIEARHPQRGRASSRRHILRRRGLTLRRAAPLPLA